MANCIICWLNQYKVGHLGVKMSPLTAQSQESIFLVTPPSPYCIGKGREQKAELKRLHDWISSLSSLRGCVQASGLSLGSALLLGKLSETQQAKREKVLSHSILPKDRTCTLAGPRLPDTRVIARSMPFGAPEQWVWQGTSESVFKSPTTRRSMSFSTFSVCARAKLSSRKRDTAWTNRR